MVHHNYNNLLVPYYQARINALLCNIEKLESENEYLKAVIEIKQNN
jgi:hypothetical protein|tara:strand:+ start:6079 stop:6216 length:138 start_codon:yes stop_codon:yes gene_type:complete